MARDYPTGASASASACYYYCSCSWHYRGNHRFHRRCCFFVALCCLVIARLASRENFPVGININKSQCVCWSTLLRLVVVMRILIEQFENPPGRKTDVSRFGFSFQTCTHQFLYWGSKQNNSPFCLNIHIYLVTTS